MKSLGAWGKRSFTTVKDFVLDAVPTSPTSAWTASDTGLVQTSDDRVLLFPGWATRKQTQTYHPDAEEQWTVDVFISGYAASFTRPEYATTAQKALLFAARNYAALPRVAKTGEPKVDQLSVAVHLSPSTEALLATKKLPPRPTEITDETERIALAQMYEDETTAEFSEAMLLTKIGDDAETPHSPVLDGLSQDEVRSLHVNLHTRMRGFWSTALQGKIIKISIYVEGDSEKPLLVYSALSDTNGAFAAQLHIPWKRLVEHPHGALIARGDPAAAQFIQVRADLVDGIAQDSVVLPITSARIRIISDIDDTIKSSDILRGARAVFQNVFVKPLDDVVIHEMASWYRSMYNRGVRFHYVSNAPWELLPVLSEFLRVSDLPQGSLKLKNYGGARQFFSNIREPAAVRKRRGVLEVLDAFLDAQFILIGDSGEQDMELYASLAHDRPFQVIAVFIRDVTTAAIARKTDKTLAEERRIEFYERVRHARALVPPHIPFRVFIDPSECVEAQQILERLDIS